MQLLEWWEVSRAERNPAELKHRNNSARGTHRIRIVRVDVVHTDMLMAWRLTTPIQAHVQQKPVKATTSSRGPLQPATRSRDVIPSQMTLGRETTGTQGPHFEGSLSSRLRQVLSIASLKGRQLEIQSGQRCRRQLHTLGGYRTLLHTHPPTHPHTTRSIVPLATDFHLSTQLTKQMKAAPEVTTHNPNFRHPTQYNPLVHLTCCSDNNPVRREGQAIYLLKESQESRKRQ